MTSSVITNEFSPQAAFPAGVSCKAQCESTIRRFSLAVPTSGIFKELRTKVGELFNLPVESFSIGYIDEEGDMVNLASDIELFECLRLLHLSPRVLRFTIIPSITTVIAPPVVPSTTVEVMALPPPETPSSVATPQTMDKPTSVTVGVPVSPTVARVQLLGMIKDQWKSLRKQWKIRKAETKKSWHHHHRKHANWREKHQAVEENTKELCAMKDLWKDLKQQYKILKRQEKERNEGKHEHKHEHKHKRKCDKFSKKFSCVLDKKNRFHPRGATFIEEVTVIETPSGEVEPGCTIRKIWRLRNDSQVAWSESKLLYLGGRGNGSLMPRFSQGQPCCSIPACAPSQVVEINLSITAPTQSGCYIGIWRMQDASGEKWGPRLWTKVVVPVTIGNQPEAGPGYTPHFIRRQQLKNFQGALQVLGFTDQVRNAALLEQFNYNYDQVLAHLTAASTNEAWKSDIQRDD